MDQEKDPQSGMTWEQRRRRFLSTDDDVEVPSRAEPEPSVAPAAEDLTLDCGTDLDIHSDPETPPSSSALA